MIQKNQQTFLQHKELTTGEPGLLLWQEGEMNATDAKNIIERAGVPLLWQPRSGTLKSWSVNGDDWLDNSELCDYALTLVSPIEICAQDLPESFVLQGFRYYSQGRKCGKDDCSCNEGELHGPYWYRREISTGVRKYMGKQLPMVVTVTYMNLRDRSHEIDADIRAARERFDKLNKLKQNEALTDIDKIILQSMGFSDCVL